MNQENLKSLFSDFVGNQAFPCVAARAALNLEQIHCASGGDIRRGDLDRCVLGQLHGFVRKYRQDPQLYQSFVIVFDEIATDYSEADFERWMWERLQAWHGLDREQYAWSDEVSPDPAAPNFGMSLGGAAFYVIGLHPNSSRMARRFSRPAVVLNLHAQFETLRANGKYVPMREAIRKRDVALSGSVNPMLADFGESSEARQYSGRRVDESWKCPFVAQRAS